MGLVLAHLSDFHFQCLAESNYLLERLPQLCGAIRSSLVHGDDVLIVYSGDIAYSGKKEEYTHALTLIAGLDAEIKEHTGRDPIHVFVPGNHDVDFDSTECDQSIRENLINTHDYKNPLTEGMEDYVLKPQHAYRNFIENIKLKFKVCAVLGLSEKVTIPFEPYSINLCMLNTARVSRLKESPGSLWLPIEAIQNVFSEKPTEETLSIAVFHHPYNWHQTENASAIKKLLESNCDVILTGHEHSADWFQKKKKSTEQNLYLEGGVAQEQDFPNYSSFNIVKIRLMDRAFNCVSHAWDGFVYEPQSDPSEHKFIRFRQPLLQRFEFTEGWEEWLEQVGTDFRHPRCTKLKLGDIFVYPDFQKLDIRKSFHPTGIVKDGDIVGFIQDSKYVLVAGAEKTGKTSFLKSLFKDLREAGYVSIFLESDFVIPKSSKVPIAERIQNSLTQRLGEIYSPDSVGRFWQTKIKERALLIDNFDELRLTFEGRDQLIRWCKDNFDIIVILASPGLRFDDLLNRMEDRGILWSFEHLNLLECDHETQYHLIKNWLMAGQDGYLVDKDELYHASIRYHQIINGIIGNGAIPSLPIYIHMMMQQLESRGSLDGVSGLYGSLYEMIIKDILLEITTNSSDLEVKINYLSVFSYAIYLSESRCMTAGQFKTWHRSYCDTYNLELVPDEMVLQFESIGIFRKSEMEIGYKYRYYYCFFLAKFIANNIHEADVFAAVPRLCATLHNADAADTMLFLCHLSKDPRILRLVLATIKSKFSAFSETDLRITPAILPPEGFIPSQLSIAMGKEEEAHIQSLQTNGEEGRPHGLDEIDPAGGTHTTEVIAMINEANSAFHSIRICGQIIKNFYGSMKGDDQIEVIRECYGACLRMMEMLLKEMERDKEEFASSLAQVIRKRFPKMSDEEVVIQTKKSLYGICLAICYGLIRHTSTSLGLSVLKPSFDKLISRESSTTSHRVLDASTRLECFDGFPENQVLNLADELERGLLGKELLRVFVWEHLKTFKTDYKVKQRICTRLKIEAHNPEIMDGTTKIKVQLDSRQ